MCDSYYNHVYLIKNLNVIKNHIYTIIRPDSQCRGLKALWVRHRLYIYVKYQHFNLSETNRSNFDLDIPNEYRLSTFS